MKFSSSNYIESSCGQYNTSIGGEADEQFRKIKIQAFPIIKNIIPPFSAKDDIIVLWSSFRFFVVLWILEEVLNCYQIIGRAPLCLQLMSIAVVLLSLLLIVSSYSLFSCTEGRLQIIFIIWSSSAIALHSLIVLVHAFAAVDFSKNMLLLMLLPLCGAVYRLPVLVLWLQQLTALGTLVAFVCSHDASVGYSHWVLLETYSFATVMGMCLVYTIQVHAVLISEDSSRIQRETKHYFKRKVWRKEQQVQSERDMALFISHEVRNPLFNITNALEFFDECLVKLRNVQCLSELPPLISSMQSFTGDVKVGVQHCTHLLTNMLNLSKIEQGKINWQDKPVNLSHLCNNVVALTRYMAQGNVRLSASVPSDIWVLCDENLLSQVLVNLVANALKFTVSGFVLLQVRHSAQEHTSKTRRKSVSGAPSEVNPKVPSRRMSSSLQKSSFCNNESQPLSVGSGCSDSSNLVPVQVHPIMAKSVLKRNSSAVQKGRIVQFRDSISQQQRLIFAVCDTGPGISKEKQGKLFQRFQQAGSHFGAGLGLMLSQKIVQFKGGNIVIQSPEWQNEETGSAYTGSMFMFTMNLKETAPSRQQSISALASSNQDSFEVPNTLQPPGLLHNMRFALNKNLGRLRRLRVLVIDDSQLNLKQLKHKLTQQSPFQDLHWSCDISRSGKEGLELVQSALENSQLRRSFGKDSASSNANTATYTNLEPFSILIVDSELSLDDDSLRDGHEVIRRIRAAEKEAESNGLKLPRMLIISYSGHIEEEHQQEAILAGADIVWSKPLPSPNQMLQDILQSHWLKMQPRPQMDYVDVVLSSDSFSQRPPPKSPLNRKKELFTTLKSNTSFQKSKIGCEDEMLKISVRGRGRKKLCSEEKMSRVSSQESHCRTPLDEMDK